MNWYHREPTLNEILSDSIVRAVMEADGIDPQELAATLKEAGRLIRRRLFFGKPVRVIRISRSYRQVSLRPCSRPGPKGASR
jgi:hypothetical protein